LQLFLQLHDTQTAMQIRWLWTWLSTKDFVPHIWSEICGE
jgi:hypothetical protein